MFYKKASILSGSKSTVPFFEDYDDRIQGLRDLEFPYLKDHAGSTLYAASLVDAVAEDLKTNLFSNPHSANASSRLSSTRIDGVRSAFLQYLNADPAHFDIIFAANATAAIKLVANGFREHKFYYYYHRDAHTSLVGIREVASAGSHCFAFDEDVEEWINEGEMTDDDVVGLFAYPAQSNMTGHRPPLSWCEQLRKSKCVGHRKIYSLLDAASYLTTGRLDLSEPSSAPDFISLSFNKIFGFPDLGALVVKKDAGHMLTSRKYFGGGTVGMVISVTDQWHAMRQESLHVALEDGTLPFHTIPTIQHALDVQSRLFGTASQISHHASALSASMYETLTGLRHWNNAPVVRVYKAKRACYGDAETQGPIVAFNIQKANETWLSKSHFETLAAACNIRMRSGGMCNPAGIAIMLRLEPWKMRRNYCEGMRCGDDFDIIGGQPTGVLRVSLGAMSTQKDVDTFIRFVDHFFVEKTPETKLPKRLSMGMDLKRFSLGHDFSTGITPVEYFPPASLPHSDKRSQYAMVDACSVFHHQWCIVDGVTFHPHTPTKAIKRALEIALAPENGTLTFILIDTAKAPDMYCNTEPEIISRPAQQRHGIDTAPSTPVFGKRRTILTIDLYNSPPEQEKTIKTRDDRIADPYLEPEILDFFSRLAGRPCTLARYRPQQKRNGMRTCEITNCHVELENKIELEMHYELHAKTFENLEPELSETEEVKKWHKLRSAYKGRRMRMRAK